MSLGPLFEPPMPARVVSSDTSTSAAKSMRHAAAHIRTRVLKHVEASDCGKTCDEIELDLGLTHQTASARVNELMRLGAIVDAGRRKTRSGRDAVVWRAAR